METMGDWEKKNLLSELTQGHDFAKELQSHIGPSSAPQVRESLLQKILRSYSTALAILRSTSSGDHPAPTAVIAGIDSPHSVGQSPRSESSNLIFADPEQQAVSKKRKTTLPKWTEQVRVSSDGGLESPVDDGYSWRKYGQKDILGAKFPRGYYRCTHRNVQGCPAKKQVQRSDEDPTVFDVTYRGKHTCAYHSYDHHPNRTSSPSPARLPPPPAPPQPKEALLSFKTNLKVKTEGLETGDLMSFPPFSFPPASIESPQSGIFSSSGLDAGNFMNGFSNSSFMSTATSECDYFPLSPCGTMSNLKGGPNMQTSESEVTEIVSASTSVQNSPMGDLDFSLDPVEFDPHFPFDDSGFFS